ncbi:queuosine 5'-phosphate N-glycosylase/hydrolase isoform X1 [Microcaecilia unicolor]|uniref:Queuosine 5'-phosphate N-glycosylase/hydrolase n=2 Tax=Microcaecilia unicolor TaxID=1415580 RepID=A0A6P7YLS0_9AMPH|nr:queuosine salvage protein isoform X1 [Microcaecilia unicolor]
MKSRPPVIFKMEVPLSPRESGKFIAENCQDVFIDPEGVRKVAEMLVDKVGNKEITLAGWKSLHELNPQAVDEDAVNWVFVADTLNFSFWSETEDHKCLVKYKGETYSGYWALCAALNRALDEGIPITKASYYATITLDQLKHVLHSDTEVPMPLIDERLRVLREAGNILLEKFGGSYLNCIKKCEKSAQKLLQLVVKNFPSYRDEAVFLGKQVAFYKRAQILVADTWCVLEGKGDGCFNDISTVTMFADYRIPQALVQLGAMRYSEELMKKLKEGEMFQYRDQQEVEIRGCSIWCVELVCKQLTALLEKKGWKNEIVNPVLLDHYLWDYARDHRKSLKKIPFHRVRCIYY